LTATPNEQPRQSAPDFKRELTQVAGHLRAFARGLCGRPDLADDLVQDTLLRAWAARDRFVPGTSIRAWTFTILRNAWFTEMRRNRFRADFDEAQVDRILTTPAGQEAPLHLADLSRALMELPAERREALLLVGRAAFPMRKPPRFADARWARSKVASGVAAPN
jgi:RNA polymerase sigma-70 factor (ECF subfamily)